MCTSTTNNIYVVVVVEISECGDVCVVVSKGLGCPQTHHQLTFEVSLQRVWDEIPTHDYINLDDKFLDAGCWLGALL